MCFNGKNPIKTFIFCAIHADIRGTEHLLCLTFAKAQELSMITTILTPTTHLVFSNRNNRFETNTNEI